MMLEGKASTNFWKNIVNIQTKMEPAADRKGKGEEGEKEGR